MNVITAHESLRQDHRENSLTYGLYVVKLDKMS